MAQLQRKHFRLTLKKKSVFAQQLHCILYNVNFTQRRFVGFLKVFLNWWGQKLFVIKWKKIFKPFFQRHFFASRKNWGLNFISNGLAWGSFFKKNLIVFFSYLIYDRFFLYKEKFLLNFFNASKSKFISLSEFFVKVKNNTYQQYKQKILFYFR